MLSALKRTFALSWSFARALPLLILLAVGFEALQHVVEWQSGMYISKAAALAAQGDAGRMIVGGTKVLALVLFGYWLSRYGLSGQAKAATLQVDPAALRKFSGYVLYELIAAIVVLGGSMLLPGSGLARPTSALLTGLLVISSVVIGVLFTPWSVAAAAGDERAGPLWSTRIAGRSFFWGLGFSLLVSIPVLVVHYALDLGAIGKSSSVAIAMLTGDALFVGALATVVAASRVVLTEHMVARAGADTVKLAVNYQARRVQA